MSISPSDSLAGPVGEKPTRVRWLMFALACDTSFVLYLHRYSWGFIKADTRDEFGWSEVQLGWLDQDENIEQDPDFSAIRLPANMMDERIHHLSAGANHTCALSFAGELLCWGNNSKVQARPGSED